MLRCTFLKNYLMVKNTMSKLSAIALLSAALLSGCASQLPTWQANITEQPPIHIDDKQYQANDWIWEDGRSAWFYRGSEEIKKQDTVWDFDAQALVFRFTSPEQLNLQDGKPHTLYLRVFQLSDVKVFNDIRRSQSGLRELLTEQDIDSSILSHHELIVEPNESEILKIDRLKETRFVAIVTGYFNLDVAESVRVFEVPAVANRVDDLNLTASDFMPFQDPEAPDGARIRAWVDLGVTKIAQLQMLAE